MAGDEALLADFVEAVMRGGATNDYYLTANNEALRQPGFAPLLADIGNLPEVCDRSQLAERASSRRCFLPLGWWHQVRSLDVSLSFSYSNLALPNNFQFANPTIREW